MLGSTFSTAGTNIALNTSVAEVLEQFANTLEGSSNFNADLAALVKKTIKTHKRIIFNGNNYSDEWVDEAEKRGISNLRTTVDALPAFISQKSIDVFTKHHVFTEPEIKSRYEILMENYCKTIHIEALTMIDIANEEIIPACINYQNDLAKLLKRKRAIGDFDCTLEERLLAKISKLSACLLKKLDALESAILKVGISSNEHDILTNAKFYRDEIFAAMNELRLTADELETRISKKHWPLPSYGELLYSVN